MWLYHERKVPRVPNCPKVQNGVTEAPMMMGRLLRVRISTADYFRFVGEERWFWLSFRRLGDVIVERMWV